MWKLFAASLVLAIPLAIMLVMLAAYHEAHQPPGGGASFETLLAIMMSIPLYLVIFPATYLVLARRLPPAAGAPLAWVMHLRVFVGFAIGSFGLLSILAYPYTVQVPVKTALENLVLAGIFTTQFIVYFEFLEYVRVRD